MGRAEDHGIDRIVQEPVLRVACPLYEDGSRGMGSYQSKRENPYIHSDPGMDVDFAGGILTVCESFRDAPPYGGHLK
jgi:hypothetical protein